MTTWKRIVILANSIKKGHRCIAGKEVSSVEGEWHVGGWIRPIGKPEDEGAVPLREMRFENGKTPHVLDIVDVPLAGPANDPNHPEDWRIDTQYYWNRVGVFPAEKLDVLEDQPDLWTARHDPRRVGDGYVALMSKPASLYLTRPPAGWQIVVFKKPIWAQGVPTDRTKIHYLLRFQMNGETHEFDVTDPDFAAAFGHLEKAPDHGEQIIPIIHPEQYFCCLSLTPAYKGHHYKILAALLK